jgi:Zn-dependent protease with chaperone function
VLTDGLLRRMSEDEVAGILAYEVAHISNNDRFAMDWATSLQRAVAITALAAIAYRGEADKIRSGTTAKVTKPSMAGTARVEPLWPRSTARAGGRCPLGDLPLGNGP